MKEIILIVAPPGAGKTTLAKDIISRLFTYTRVSQDEQGRKEHMDVFENALAQNHDIIIDRMNFSKDQRDRYLVPAKALGYKTKIIVLHENFDTCMTRMHLRKDHPTIRNNDDATSALYMFYKKYERVEDSEADVVERRWPDREKPMAIICDMDNTLSNADHREHFLQGEKKNWRGFFEAMDKDPLNGWCRRLITTIQSDGIDLIICSGRPDDYRMKTSKWLTEHQITPDQLFMRARGDFRRDDITKEVILDFEILTRNTVLFAVDDRDQVVKMLRKRGIVCLQCREGAF